MSTFLENRQMVFISAVDASGVGDVAVENVDLTGMCWFPIRAVLQITETVAGTGSDDITVALKWRPTPGSASGAVTFGTFTVADGLAADTTHYVNLLNQPGTSTSVVSAGATTGGGIGGSTRYEAKDESTFHFGPGGDLQVDITIADNNAGIFNLWLEVGVLGAYDGQGDVDSELTVS